MPENPMTVVFDPEEVAPLLRAAARAMAYDMNSSLVWKDDKVSPTASLGDKLSYAALNSISASWDKVLYATFNCAHPLTALDGLLRRPYVRGNEEVDINYKKVEADTEQNFKMFCANFARFVAQSPAQGVQYLQEKKMQVDRCYANMSYKFEAARKIQNRVQRVLTDAVDNTYRVKVAADIGMAVGLAFTPVWFAVPGGILYTLATEIAKTRIEVDGADVGLIKKTVTKKDVQENLAVGTTYATAQGYAEKCEKDAEKVVEEAEKVAEKVEARCAEKIKLITAKAGENLNREARKQIARQTEKTLAENEAVELAKRSAGLPGALAKSFKVGGIAAALYFMKDDIYKAWHGYTATEREELLKKGAKAKE